MIAIAGLHVSEESRAVKVRLLDGRPFWHPIFGAGASAASAGWIKALPYIVEQQASYQSAIGDSRHANESLKRTSAAGLPCEWLASTTWILHLLAWRVVARRLAPR